MLIKIISGGQSGADMGGLKAAKILKLECGGTVPRGCWTELGPNIKLTKNYNCKESISSGYQPRTIANVCNSDGTVIFANDWSSPGCICTLTAISMENKPVFRVDPKNKRTLLFKEFQSWLNEHNIRILNVAGHRATKYPGIEQFVTKWLVKALKKSKKKS